MFIERPLNLDCTIIRWWAGEYPHFTIITGVEEFMEGGLKYAVVNRFNRMLQPKSANYFIIRFFEELRSTGIIPATFNVDLNKRMRVKQ